MRPYTNCKPVCQGPKILCNISNTMSVACFIGGVMVRYSYRPHLTYRSYVFYIKVQLLSTPMGVDYVVIWFDMEVQPLVTHNAA